MRTYEVYCGNFECRHRASERLFTVVSADDMPETAPLPPGVESVLPSDGTIWVCPECEPARLGDA